MTWQRIVNYSAKLAGRAVAHRWPWLFVAPMVAVVCVFLLGPIGHLGTVGGFILGFVIAAALSLVLYVGRGIIEQRRLDVEDLTRGLGAFMSDTMNVLFVFWIASLVGQLLPPVSWAVGALLVATPVFEAVALTPVSGYGAFGSGWRFFQRNAGPWLFGQWPVAALLALARFVVLPLLDPWAVRFIDATPQLDPSRALLALYVFVYVTIAFAGFIYRGILFLALDSVAPHARAAKFGRA